MYVVELNSCLGPALNMESYQYAIWRKEEAAREEVCVFLKKLQLAPEQVLDVWKSNNLLASMFDSVTD